MKIDRNEARRIAALAHLEMNDEALDRMAAEMTSILGYIDQLRDAPIDSAVASTAAATTPLRDDVVRPSIERDAVAANAPAWNDGFFVVPRIVGGD